MLLELETEAGKLVKRNLGKILAAFVGGFLVFAVIVFVSIRYRAGLVAIRSSPVRISTGESTEIAPTSQTVPAETATAGTIFPPSGTEVLLGRVAPDSAPKTKTPSRAARKLKQPKTLQASETIRETELKQLAAPAIPEETAARQKERPVPQPEPIIVPADTQVAVQLTEPLSTKEVHQGSIFHGILSTALEANGHMLATAGAAIAGRIVDSKRAGLLGRHSILSLELTQVTDEEGHTVPIHTTQWYVTGKRGRLPVLTFGARDGAPSESTESPNSVQIRGSDISVPRGAIVSFRLMRPVQVP